MQMIDFYMWRDTSLHVRPKKVVCFLKPYPNKFLLKKIPTPNFFRPANS